MTAGPVLVTSNWYTSCSLVSVGASTNNDSCPNHVSVANHTLPGLWSLNALFRLEPSINTRQTPPTNQ